MPTTTIREPSSTVEWHHQGVLCPDALEWRLREHYDGVQQSEDIGPPSPHGKKTYSLVVDKDGNVTALYVKALGNEGLLSTIGSATGFHMTMSPDHLSPQHLAAPSPVTAHVWP